MASVALLAVLMAAVVAVSESCSCGPFFMFNPLEGYCSFDVVIQGMALSKAPEPAAPNEMSWFTLYTVRVDRPIRVPDSLRNVSTITVKTATQSSMCGTGFTLNTVITVLGRLNADGTVRTGLCDYQSSVLDLASRGATCPAREQ